MARPGFEADQFAIMLRDVASGETRRLAADWDRSADSLKWSADGRTIYVTAGDVGQTRVFAIDVRRGSVVQVTGPGHVSAFDLTPSGVVFAQDALDRISFAHLPTARCSRRAACVPYSRWLSEVQSLGDDAAP